MLKKLSISLISIILAVLMGTLVPLQAFATDTTYIKEIAVEYGSTIDEAKAALTKKGYTPMDADFGRGGVKAVAIGYISTKNKDEAITDLKVMEEKCGYDFLAYEDIIKEKKSEVATLYNELSAAIEQFREEYADGDGTEIAATSYEVMNYFLNDDMTDDNGKAMGVGDMIISEDTTDDQFKTLLLESNIKVLGTIEQYLGMTCATTDWVSEAPDCEAADSISATEAKNAKNIYNTLEQFQSEMRLYEALPVNSDSTEEEIDAFNNSSDYTDAQKLAFTHISPIYDKLKETAYLDEDSLKDPTLYGLFMSDLDSLSMKTLVPLANLMSEGQIATFGYLPLYASISSCGADDDTWADAISKTNEQVDTSDMKQISAYAGVNRELFTPEGIALTNAAMVQKNSTNSAEFGYKKAGVNDTIRLALVVGSVALFVVGIALNTIGRSSDIPENIARWLIRNVPTDQLTDSTLTNTMTKVGTAFKIVGGIIIAIAAAIFIAVILYKEIFDFIQSKKHVEYTEMPRVMVDEDTASDNEIGYLYYNCATDLSGNLADLNSWNGTHWIGLYYTYDSNAGDPVPTSYVVQYGETAITQSSSLNYRALTMFGSQGAKNLNNNGLADPDGAGKTIAEEDHVYLYFTSPKASTSASVFADSAVLSIVTGFGGLAVGVIATVIAFNIRNKKKQQVAETTTTSN